MKKQYQINKQRAAERFEDWAIANESPIQLTFPTPRSPSWQIQPGRSVASGWQALHREVMETEVEHLVGQRSKR